MRVPSARRPRGDGTGTFGATLRTYGDSEGCERRNEAGAQPRSRSGLWRRRCPQLACRTSGLDHEAEGSGTDLAEWDTVAVLVEACREHHRRTHLRGEDARRAHKEMVAAGRFDLAVFAALYRQDDAADSVARRWHGGRGRAGHTLAMPAPAMAAQHQNAHHYSHWTSPARPPVHRVARHGHVLGGRGRVVQGLDDAVGLAGS
jgi:hypothetical protein